MLSREGRSVVSNVGIGQSLALNDSLFFEVTGGLCDFSRFVGSIDLGIQTNVIANQRSHRFPASIVITSVTRIGDISSDERKEAGRHPAKANANALAWT